jgi:SAM-dependent methyltransferase
VYPKPGSATTSTVGHVQRRDRLHSVVMLLNAVEKALMNNPARAAVQRHFEAKRLLDLGGSVAGGRVLEVGCGRGVGVEIILDLFGAGSVDAFDLDPDMVARARARHAGKGSRVRLWVGDAEKIQADDATYDAVFDFAIIHHVPAWRNALREVARVLKPGGRFYAEEVLAHFIHHPVWRRVLDHPMEDRFDRHGFEAGLSASGLKVLGSNQLLGSFAWFVAVKPLQPVALAGAGIAA